MSLMGSRPLQAQQYRSLALSQSILLLCLPMLWATLALSGCVSVAGGLTTKATSLNFGNVAQGSTSRQSLTVTNSTSSTLTVTKAVASGKGFAVSGPKLPLTLGAGQSATFTTTFAPTSVGNASGSVSITSGQETPGAQRPTGGAAPASVTTQTTIIATNGAGVPPAGSLQITGAALPNAQAGVAFQTSLAATGGTQPYHWTMTTSTLPTGLSLGADTGVISGTTTHGGQFSFIVQLSDSSTPAPQTAMKAFTLTVLAFALQVNSGGLPSGQVGVAYQASANASGGVTPYTWSVTGALPAGLALNPPSGTISGTPTQAGASSFTLQVTDAAHASVQAPDSITIAAAGGQPLSISTATLSPPTVGQAYFAKLQATGGTPPYTWNVQSGLLPGGLSLSAAGQITGTPSAGGVSSFTAQVTDSASPKATASKSFSLSVSAAASLDQYGGDAKHPCAGVMKNGSPIPGATGFFYLYKDANLKHWMFCDPAGNRFWMTAVQVFDNGGGNFQSIVNAKYAGNSVWGQESIRIKSIGFNSIGEYGSLYALPVPVNGQPTPTNPTLMPFIWTISPAHYNCYAVCYPLKDMFANLPPIYTGNRNAPGADLFDPNWVTIVHQWATSTISNTTPFTGGAPALDASPWLIGVGEDDSDWIGTFKGGLAAWEVGVSAPYEQFENSPGWSRQQVFPDPVMHLKQQWSAWLCGTRYANISALNAAWGSTYTTCGSSAAASGIETIGSGDGSTTSFSYVLQHTNVDPASIGISIDGALQGGDCPWFNTACGGATGTGKIQAGNEFVSSNINGGTVTYSTGAITVTFSVPPVSGVAITTTYQYSGWPKAMAGGTGLLDEDGTSAWWPSPSIPDPAVTTITTDMDNFYGQMAQAYFKTIHDWLKTQLPHHLVFSTDPFNSASRNRMLANSLPYVDAMNLYAAASPSWNQASQQSALLALYNTYHTPGYFYIIKTAQPDSQFSPSGCPIDNTQCFVTQGSKGQSYHSDVAAYVGNDNSTYVGSDGYGYIVGVDYWQFTDNTSESGAYGLVSLRDNLYNGVESCGKSVVDPWGFTTVPESTSGCYGDFVSSVKAGNGLWLGQ